MATLPAILLSAFLFSAASTISFSVSFWSFQTRGSSREDEFVCRWVGASVAFSREQEQSSCAKTVAWQVFAQDDCSCDPDERETTYLAAAAAALLGSHQIVTLMLPGFLPMTTN